nr:hypothetical protein [uncultured Chryseobacterium sp.]
MQKKILSDQSLEELKKTEKKHKFIVIFFTISFFVITGIAVYLTLENDISIYTALPLLFIPIFIYVILQLKKVKDEIKVRTAHIFLQKKMQNSKR